MSSRYIYSERIVGSLENYSSPTPTIIPGISTPPTIIALENGTANDDGTSLIIGSAVGIVLSFFVVYLVLKIFDRFGSTDVREEYLASMIRRMEGGGLTREKSNTIFFEMTQDERRNVLGQVLLQKVSGHTYFSSIIILLAASRHGEC